MSNRNNLILHNFDGHTIEERVSDGYYNATAMCKSRGKRWHDWDRQDGTEALLDAISRRTGIPVNELVQSVSGQGTWVQRDVALALAMWLDPDLHAAVIGWVLEGKPKHGLPQDYPSALRALADQVDLTNKLVEEKAAADTRNKHLEERNRITEPSHAGLHDIKDQSGTVAVTWMAKWLGIPPRTGAYVFIKDQGWAYRLGDTWVPTEANSRLKKPYVMRWREVINGKMRMGIELTWKGAMRMLYSFGQQAREAELREAFQAENRKRSKQAGLDS